MTRRSVVLLGDIKGTKAALDSGEGNGLTLTERRIAHLHDSFGTCFMRFAPRSRSLCGMTFSDSVIAHWSDPVEGRRFCVDFMTTLWSLLDRSLVVFRGFLDTGDAVGQTSPLTYVLNQTNDRFLRTLPVSVALWSVTVAEASHFPDGLYISALLASEFDQGLFETGFFEAPPFRYMKMRPDVIDRIS
jgi:hypothetical protein